MKTNPSSALKFTLAGLMLLLAFSVQASPSNKWRLQFSGNAESSGTIVMQFTPKGSEMIETRTDIKKGRSENHVARDVVDSLKSQLPKDHFHIERDDGEDVLIKRKHHHDAKFDIKIVSNSVKGVRINPDRE
ncbi:hypothetical protein G0Q06_05850 [Puniceicoccales bacterium CK1056]|uniref:PepSY domain-containing protein n=1 Tax=Oceanipulchritudo coccoides TaxID=2706888 RepID=A0A6B2LZ91_9BACT|nr:hypothetical protein [Oceanipulchritudo coccoides]NDV61968.1 hypothetical protein [Oceanipulchritudo coccoides]